jgi:hypothetical protein
MTQVDPVQIDAYTPTSANAADAAYLRNGLTCLPMYGEVRDNN